MYQQPNLPSSLNRERVSYLLAKAVPAMRNDGCTISVGYGHIDLTAEQSAAVADIVERVLRAELDA